MCLRAQARALIREAEAVARFGDDQPVRWQAWGDGEIWGIWVGGRLYRPEPGNGLRLRWDDKGQAWWVFGDGR